jgi:hypothetical protein
MTNDEDVIRFISPEGNHWGGTDSGCGLRLVSPTSNEWAVDESTFRGQTLHVVTRHEVAFDDLGVFGILGDQSEALTFIRDYVD